VYFQCRKQRQKTSANKRVSNLLALISTAPGKVVFMAGTGPLIKQQANRFKKYLPMLRVSGVLIQKYISDKYTKGYCL